MHCTPLSITFYELIIPAPFAAYRVATAGVVLQAPAKLFPAVFFAQSFSSLSSFFFPFSFIFLVRLLIFFSVSLFLTPLSLITSAFYLSFSYVFSISLTFSLFLSSHHFILSLSLSLPHITPFMFDLFPFISSLPSSLTGLPDLLMLPSRT